MSDKKQKNGHFLVRNIKLPFEKDQAEAFEIAKRRLSFVLGTKAQDAKLVKRSIDARKKPLIQYVYTVSVDAPCPKDMADKIKKAGSDFALVKEEPLVIPIGTEKPDGRPIVVGFGPCGMFASLLLAEKGYRPIVIERGGDLTERVRCVDTFYQTKILDEETNIQFGAGGAGTFSDGKLVTRINDPFCHYVLSQFVRFGADQDVLVNAKPHIGTDVLQNIVTAIADRLIQLGAELRFHTKLESFVSAEKGVTIRTNQGDIHGCALIMALGHSARDTYQMLMEHDVKMEAKPFSVGVRIEHLQKDIDAALYGAAAGHPLLPPGEYALSKRQGERGVYTFCMCPGGEVVAAASEQGGLVVNGMSCHARNGKNANAAIAVSVLPQDFGSNPMSAIAFQRQLEQNAFLAGGKTWAAPIQTVSDFLQHRSGSKASSVKPTYMNGFTKPADLYEILPKNISSMLEMGIRSFGCQIKGFDSPFAILTGVETRTSAPVRILRNSQYHMEQNPNIYPAGEGAGYAGGITSAAVDGIHCALKLMERFCPME